MTTSSRPPLVEVTWVDSFTHDAGWMTADDYVTSANTEEYLIRTVGFLLAKTPKRVILSPSRDHFGKCSGIWVIPTPMIRRIRRLS